MTRSDPPFRAVVFDLDGTLVDTLPDILPPLNRLMAANGRRDITYEEGRRMVGMGSRTLIERAFAATGTTPPAGTIDSFYRQFLDEYIAEPAVRSAPFPGLAGALDELAAAGAVFGVCTNKPHEATLAVLDALSLSPRFEAVIGGDAAPRRKPDAGHLLAVLDRMAATADEAVMVGDSEIDVATARAAGIPIVAVDFGYTAMSPEALGADALISDFEGLPQALCRLAKNRRDGREPRRDKEKNQ